VGCRYEEEIYRKYGRVEECGCKNCPYKNLEQCKEVSYSEEKDLLCNGVESKER